ncbi:MAG: hypothetical protein QM756_39855 [Polyangiaceae bacterium]
MSFRLPCRGSIQACRQALSHAGFVLGALCVYHAELSSPRRRAERRTLVRAFEPELALPVDVGRPSYESAPLPPRVWLSLGYLSLGPRAVRVDLAERVAAALVADDDAARALSSFGVPRFQVPRTLSAFGERLHGT